MLRRLPNLLTSLRIVAIPFLVSFALEGHNKAFAKLLIACLVGDIVDGLLARALKATSPLGAMLDSVADALLFIVAGFGAWKLEPVLLRANPVSFTLIPALWLSEYAIALIRYGRLSSFHTYLSRIAAYAMGIFIGLMFIGAFQEWLLHVAVVTVAAATIEEFVLLALLPTWTPDVRGVWWVLKARRTAMAVVGALL